jgi:hypothetical protein
MPAPPVLPAFFGATNARAHDAAPLPLWNAGQAKHHAGASLSLRRNGSFTSSSAVPGAPLEGRNPPF